MSKSKRNIIKIDEDKCDGCGLCIPSCKEGALQIIDGKARLVSEVYCDGLGACLGECPQGALTIEERDAVSFDEDEATKHVAEISRNESKLPCGCPGTMAKTLNVNECANENSDINVSSKLGQWPVQLSLIPVNAPYLKEADLLMMADCVAVAYPNLHRDFLRGRAIAIACPKLDDTEPYVEKLAEIIRCNNLRSVEVVMMEVPCCGGLLQIVEKAKSIANSDVRINKTQISVEGKIL